MNHFAVLVYYLVTLLRCLCYSRTRLYFYNVWDAASTTDMEQDPAPCLKLYPDEDDLYLYIFGFDEFYKPVGLLFLGTPKCTVVDEVNAFYTRPRSEAGSGRKD